MSVNTLDAVRPSLLTVCTKGYNSLTHAEVNHAPGNFVYSMGILYGANFNMVDRTAGQLESTLSVSNVCAQAFEPRTS